MRRGEDESIEDIGSVLPADVTMDEAFEAEELDEDEDD